MAAKTWNVDRQKGGSYEFSLDASGNYKLNSVGFNKVKTLNLPELKKDTTAAATTTKDTKTASDQTTKAFGDVQPFYYDKKGGGGDQYTSEYQMKKEGDLATDQTMTKGAWDTGKWGPKPGDTTPITTKKADTIPVWAQGVDKRGYGKMDTSEVDISPDKKQIGRVNVDQVLDARAQVDRFGTGQWGPKPSSGMPITPSDRQPGLEIANKRVTPQKTKVSETALKAVKSASSVLSKAVGFVMDNTLVGKIAGGIVSPQQRGYNQRNQEAFSSLGYKTRGELGSNIDPGRVAGNPADNVFAGMNEVSARGDVMQGARNRIATRKSAKTQARISKLSEERQKAFNDKTKEFERQTQEVQATKNKQDLAKGGVAPGASGGGGNGGGKGRVICTELHSTGEMSTRDWLRDIKFTYKDLSKEHIKGYLLWAVPTVEHIIKYPTYRKFWKHIAQHRANDIAWRLKQGKFDLLGRIYAGIGEPLCWLIGKCVSDKQIKKLELNNWRQA